MCQVLLYRITPEELKKLDEPCISYNGKLYTEYEVSQMQRAQERRVRAWKRRCITAQEGAQSATDEATRATAQAEFDRSARYLKTNEAKLKDFCRQTGQDRDRFREQVLGFNRSTAQKAVHAAKKSGLTSGGGGDIIRDERVTKAIEENRISLKLNPEKQNPHIYGSSAYHEKDHKSYFTVTIEELQEIVNRYHGTGNVLVKKNGQIKEIIKAEKDFGICINEKTGEPICSTNEAVIHYSKKRTHIVPKGKEDTE